MAAIEAGTRLVGREQELVELLRWLDDARVGRGRLVLLGGEPGIGKSRLADELAARARGVGADVFWGRGWEDAGAPPYWPWVQVLRAYVRSHEPHEIRDDLGGGARDLIQILPELREVLPDVERPADQASDSARFQLFDSTATLLRASARRRPLLIVLDDLQAADASSILLLRFVASQLADMSLMLVATYRDIELTPDHPLTPVIADVAHEPVSRLISLAGLPAAAVGDLIVQETRSQERLVSAAGRRLARAVWRATGGNPLFVGEALRLLTAEGRLGGPTEITLRLIVPAGVRSAIARRIERLRPELVALLRVAAVVGPEVDVDLLRHVADEPQRVQELLAEAVEAGLVVPVIGMAGRFRFAHDLIRETLYRDVASADRARLHRLLVESLEAMHGGNDDLVLDELAHHAVEAVRDVAPGSDASGALSDAAVGYARRAADRAARSLGYEEAVRLYRMAVEVLEREPNPDPVLLAEILLSLGDVQARASGLEDARPTLLRAAVLARKNADGRQLARAALGIGGRLPWARPGRDAALLPLLQDALVMLGGADERLRVLLLSRLACAWRSSPERRADSDALSRQAIDIARGLNDPAVLSYALSGRFWATWWPENPGDRERLSAEIVTLAEALGDGERIIDAHLIRFLSLGELGRLADARVELDTLVRGIDELRQPAQQWLEPVNRGYLAVAVGDFDLAERMVSRQLEADDYYTPARDGLSAARVQRFLIRRVRGGVAEEEATVRASVQDFPWYPFHRAALACLLADLGRTAEAHAVFDDLARDDFRALYRDNEWLFGMSLASEACALLGDSAAAAVLYGQLAPFAGRNAIAHAEGCVGAVDRYLGLLAVTRGDLDAGVRHLEAAIALNEAMGARPWLALSQHDLATILRSRAAPGDAILGTHLDGDARRIAVELGMQLAEDIAPDRAGDDLGTGLAAAQTLGPARDREHQAESPPGSRRQAMLRLEGDYWLVRFEAETIRVHDSKGMRYLARLLAAPGTEIHALDLAGGPGGSTVGPSATPRAAGLPAHWAGDRDDAIVRGGFGDAGPILDAEAKAAYRTRLLEIRDERAEAERWNDPERLSRLDAEAAALAGELTSAMGLGGRDRVAAAAAERARVSVTRAIRAAMRRIAGHSEVLGGHLDASIRTGIYCSYVHDPSAPIDWQA